MQTGPGWFGHVRRTALNRIPDMGADSKKRDDLIGSIMDGRLIDWRGLKADSSRDGDEQSMAALEELARIAEFHRRLQSADHLDGPGTVAMAPYPPAHGLQPRVVRLQPAAPNPFAQRTVIAFDLTAAGPVRLAIHDEAGQHLKTLADESLPAGSHERIWDRTDASGRTVAAGTYFVRINAETSEAKGKLTVLP